MSASTVGRAGAAADARAEFEELYRATCDALLRYLIRRCGDAEEAADLLAETYLTAWDKLDVMPTGEQAQLWLYGVARNLLLRSVRRRRVADHLIQRLADALRAGQDHEPSNDRLSQALRRAVLDLSERDREILTLTAWEGLAPRDIASVLGISPNIVRIRLHRARARVRRDLDAPLDLFARAVARPKESGG